MAPVRAARSGRQGGTGRHGGSRPWRSGRRGKRRFLVGATSVVGGIGGVAAAMPFVLSLFPSERAKAAGAPVEQDIGKMEPGQQITLEWRGRVVLGDQPHEADARVAAQARQAARRSEFGRSAAAAVLQERASLDQARVSRRRRDLHAPRLLADVPSRGRARRPGPRLARRLLLPVPPVEVRPRGSRVQRRSRADQPRDPAAQVPVRHAASSSESAKTASRRSGPVNAMDTNALQSRKRPAQGARAKAGRTPGEPLQRSDGRFRQQPEGNGCLGRHSLLLSSPRPFVLASDLATELPRLAPQGTRSRLRP